MQGQKRCGQEGRERLGLSGLKRISVWESDRGSYRKVSCERSQLHCSVRHGDKQSPPEGPKSGFGLDYEELELSFC